MDSGWRSRPRHTESPPARPRFSTTTAWSSGRACCDGRPDRPHDSSQRGLRERRPARPRGGRRPAQPPLGGGGPAVTHDRIVLTSPRNEGFENVAQLVLAGVAARLNFTYEVVDDLGTALETLLERRGEEGELTVELEVGEDTVKAALGPFAGDGLRAELDQPAGGVGRGGG